jgi:hypothetical protein
MPFILPIPRRYSKGKRKLIGILEITYLAAECVFVFESVFVFVV